MTGARLAHQRSNPAGRAGGRRGLHEVEGGGRGDVRRVVCGVALSYDPLSRLEDAGQGGIEGSSLRADLVGKEGDRSW